MNNRLESCPFCGGIPRIEYGWGTRYILFEKQPVRTAKAVCCACGASSKEFQESTDYCAADKAAEAWNKRVTDGR